MKQTAMYRFHEFTLKVRQARGVTGVDLAPLLDNLSWVGTNTWGKPPALCLTIRPLKGKLPLPPAALQRFKAEGVRVLEHGEEIYLTDRWGIAGAPAAPARAGRGAARPFIWRPTAAPAAEPVGLQSAHAAPPPRTVQSPCRGARVPNRRGPPPHRQTR
jgi:hypothetical protein